MYLYCEERLVARNAVGTAKNALRFFPSLLDGVYDAWIAFDDGCCYGSRVTHGIRPAMLLDSALKVHVEHKCRRTDRGAAPVSPVLKSFYITDERAYLRLLKILDEGKIDRMQKCNFLRQFVSLWILEAEKSSDTPKSILKSVFGVAGNLPKKLLYKHGVFEIGFRGISAKTLCLFRGLGLIF